MRQYYYYFIIFFNDLLHVVQQKLMLCLATVSVIEREVIETIEEGRSRCLL